MDLDLSTRITLNNGVEIPVLGLGTWQTRTERIVVNAVSWAFEAGYRLIDTAWVYHNEKYIGKAFKKSGLDREDFFITTKLWNDHHGYDKALQAIDFSLNNLDLDYVDLYLIHWPVSQFTDTWKAMEIILEEGKARAIGVSNFLIQHLEQLLSVAEVIPAVNQIEFTPYLYLKDLYDYCNGHKIKIEAYSPLTRGKKLNEPELIEIADNYEVLPTQVLIRWGLQHGLIEIPKSSRKNKIFKNAQVFDFHLTVEDMKKLNGFNENLRVCGSTPHKRLTEKYLKK
ncbi:MAG: aldo/keto reductase [Candidatus Hodarchaeales archaeon]